MYAASASTSEFCGAFWSEPKSKSSCAPSGTDGGSGPRDARNVPRPKPPTVTRCVLVSGLRPCADSSARRENRDRGLQEDRVVVSGSRARAGTAARREQERGRAEPHYSLRRALMALRPAVMSAEFRTGALAGGVLILHIWITPPGCCCCLPRGSSTVIEPDWNEDGAAGAERCREGGGTAGSDLIQPRTVGAMVEASIPHKRAM